MHGWSRDDIASIYYQSLDTNSANPRCDIQTGTQRPKHPKERIHRHRNDEQDKQINEELTSRPRQIGQEIYDEIETNYLNENNRNISSKLSKGVSGRPIEGKGLMFEENRSCGKGICQFC